MKVKKIVAISMSIVILLAILIAITQLTGLSRYITPDLLLLIGMVFAALLMLAAMLIFIILDFRKLYKKKKKSFSEIQNVMNIVSNSFRHTH